MSPGPLAAQLEAVLLVADEPVPAVALATAVEHPVAEVEAALVALSTSYAEEGRGFELRTVAGGWRFYTAPAQAAVVERFVVDGQPSRLTPAALETLAIVAYQQPVTRARVAAIRGVSVDSVVRSLSARGLVTETGTDPETGALLLGTTPLFLEKLGLTSLADLPSLAPLLPDLDEVSGVG